MNSPIPWPGGKRLMTKRLLKLLPDHNTYIEPFSGGAGLLFAKQPSNVEVINDIDGELINFFRTIKNHKNEFVGSFNLFLHSRRWFCELQAQNPSELDHIQRAVRFYYLRKASFGGLGTHFASGKKYNPACYLQNLEKSIDKASKRLRTVTIEEMTHTECLRRYDSPYSLFYCDPPYRIFGDRLYCRAMNEQDYILLRMTLGNIKGKWILSHSDDPLIRLLFKGYEILPIKTKYTLAGGKHPRSFRKPGKELLISNFPLKK